MKFVRKTSENRRFFGIWCIVTSQVFARFARESTNETISKFGDVLFLLIRSK